MGSNFEARVAGSHTANSATALNTTGTVTNTIGSSGFDPEEEAGNEAGDGEGWPMPTIAPTIASRMPCQTTRLRNHGADGAESHADAHFLCAAAAPSKP